MRTAETQARRKPKKPRRPPPRGDTKSDVGLTPKQAQQVRKAVRETYREQPLERRKELTKTSQKRPGPAAEAIRKEHRSRVKAERLIVRGVDYQKRVHQAADRGKPVPPPPSREERRGMELAGKVLPKRLARDVALGGIVDTLNLTPHLRAPEKKGVAGAVMQAMGAAAEPVGVRPKKKPLLRPQTLEGQRKTLAGAIRVLEELNRPLYLTAGTAKELAEGKRVDQALKKGVTSALDPTLDKDDKVYFSDVLKSAGVKNKYVRGIAGFGLDIVLNPATYATFGVGAGAQVGAKGAYQAARKGIDDAVREAHERALFKAAHKGVSRAVAEKTAAKAARDKFVELSRKASRAADEAYAAGNPHRGVKMGVRKPLAMRVVQNRRRKAQGVPGKTERIAWVGGNVSPRFVGSGISKRAAESKAGKALQRSTRETDFFTTGGDAAQLSSTFRPRDVSWLEDMKSRSIGNEARRRRSSGESQARERVEGYQRYMREKNIDAEGQRRIILAIDAGDVGSLDNDAERRLAQIIQKDLREVAESEAREGFRQTIRQNYFPRIVRDEAEAMRRMRRKGKLTKEEELGLGTLRSKPGAGGRSMNQSSNRKRIEQRTLRDLEENAPEVFERYVTDDLALPLLLRYADSARGKSLYRLQNRIGAELGREVTDADLLNIGQLLREGGLFQRTRTGFAGIAANSKEEAARNVERYLDRMAEGIPAAQKRELVRLARGDLRAAVTEGRRGVREAERAAAREIRAAERAAGAGRLAAEREGQGLLVGATRDAGDLARQAARRGGELERDVALEGGRNVARAERRGADDLLRAEREVANARVDVARATGASDRLRLQQQVRQALRDDENYLTAVQLENEARRQLRAAKEPAEKARLQGLLDEARILRREEGQAALERLTERSGRASAQAAQTAERQGAREAGARAGLEQTKRGAGEASTARREAAAGARQTAREEQATARELAVGERGAARRAGQEEVDAARELLRMGRVDSLQEGRALIRQAVQAGKANIRAARQAGKDNIDMARMGLAQASRQKTLPRSEMQVIHEGPMERAFEMATRGRNTRSSHLAGRAFDEAQARLKWAQTLANVPFYATNMIGDAFLFRLADGDWANLAKGFKLGWNAGRLRKARLTMDRDIRKGFIRAGEVFDYPAYGKTSVVDTLRAAEELGVPGINYYAQEIRQLLDEGLDVRGAGPLARVGAGINQFNQARERIARLGLFHDRLMKGDTFEEAADFVANSLIDYSNLTKTEREFMRRVIPYYTFFSRNTVLQSKGLVTRPGTYSTYESARQEAAATAGLEEGWEKDLPIYDQAGLPIPIPGLSTPAGQPILAYPKLPITDLNTFTPSPEFQRFNLLSRTSSLIKAPAEQIARKNFFFDAEFAPRTRVDPLVADAVEALAGLSIIPGVKGKVGRIDDYYDRRTGKSGTAINTRVDNLLRLLPQYTALNNLLGANDTPDALARRTPGVNYALASQLLGVRFGEFDPTLNLRRQVHQRYGELEDEIKALEQRVEKREPGDTRKRGGKLGELYKQRTELLRLKNQLEKEAGWKDPGGLPKAKKKKRGGTYGRSSGKVYGRPGGGKVYGRP